jgi:radical SAM protein with 4Fe4S-binding SPASM domain
MRRELSILGHYAAHSPKKLRSLARMVYRTKILSAKGLRKENHSSHLPPLMTLQVNNVCNLRCVQCWEWGDNGAYKGWDAKTLKDEMSTAQWEDLIHQAGQWKPFLYFFGGEPLLRKDMTELIRIASGEELLCALNSNTTLMTYELAESFISAGLDYYIASLDGPAEINDRIRIGRDVFRNTINGIRNLVRARESLNTAFPLIEVCTTVTAENAHHILETAELVNDLKVDFFKVQLGMFTTPKLLEDTKARFVQTFGVEPKLLSGYIRDTSTIDANSLARQDAAIEARSWTFEFMRYPKHNVSNFDYSQYYSSPSSIFGEKICHVPWMRAVVLPNGDVAGCPWLPEARIGNVTQQRFVEIWNGREMRQFRRSLEEDGLFPSCSRCCDLYELDESHRFGLRARV